MLNCSRNRFSGIGRNTPQFMKMPLSNRKAASKYKFLGQALLWTCYQDRHHPPALHLKFSGSFDMFLPLDLSHRERIAPKTREHFMSRDILSTSTAKK